MRQFEKTYAAFMAGPGKNMTWNERVKWDYQAWGQEMSIAGLWSYRGKLWKKYAGSLPTPEEMELPPDHPFFDPDVVCESQVMYRSGKKGPKEYRHHGRLLKPGHRLYPSEPPTSGSRT